jgi:hypothetical protein
LARRGSHGGGFNALLTTLSPYLDQGCRGRILRFETPQSGKRSADFPHDINAGEIIAVKEETFHVPFVCQNLNVE